MAVLGRLLLGSSERFDLPDLLSIDSYTASDFKYMIRSFIGAEKPYILTGFDVIQPQDSIGTESVSIRVADSVVYYPGSQAGSFYFGLPEGDLNAQPLLPELRKNATNFVYLTFDTFDTAKDSRAFWDPDQNGGAGGEFSQDVNTESVLKVVVNVSVSTFPENTIPICKVTVGASVIESIQDCRDQMFRLGSGGVNPNPFHTFDFRPDPSSLYERTEPSDTMNSALDPNPFQGGDKNIRTLKEWMDVVMTRLKEISGLPYWYQGPTGGGGGTPPNLENVYLDTLGSTLKSKGKWNHSGVTPGNATWTEDIHYYSLKDPRDIIIRANTISIATDDRVAWIRMIRDVEPNNSSTAVSWQNGSTTVNGVTGAFSNLVKGDWIKKKTDGTDKYLRVEEFYSLSNLAGGTTTPALAQSIRLMANYAGGTATELGQYTKGEYLLSDINITARDAASVQTAGGDFYWLAYRSDTVLGLSGAVPTALNLDITDSNGKTAKATASAAHGLQDGDRVTIVGGAYAGTYVVEVEDTTHFYINTTVTGDLLAQPAYYAIVTTAARSTPYSFSLETANHGFETNQRIYIAGTSSAYDSNYLINVRSATTFQIPIPSLIPNPGPVAGNIVRMVRLNVRTEFGTVKIVQGESVDIGEADSANILSYIGMPSLAQTKPIYLTPSTTGAIGGYENYNSDENDNLTIRVSRLTSMMADRVQDRGLRIIGRTNITSVTSGLNQNISALANLTFKKPVRPDQIITLTTPIALPANSVIVAQLDRDGNTAITPTVESWGSSVLLSENKIILFYRFAGTTVYDWLGNQIEPSGHINTGAPEDAQNKNVTCWNPGLVRLNAGTGLLTLDVNRAYETVRITTIAGASVPQSSYFYINAAHNTTQYYVWYDVNGGGTDPLLAGRVGIHVAILSGDTASQVATKTNAAINTIGGADFTSTVLVDKVTVVNDAFGFTIDAADGGVPTTFQIQTLIQGVDPDIEIEIPGASDKNIVDVDAINLLGTLTLSDGDCAWVRINRFALKTFNTVQYTDLPDTDGAGSIYVTSLDSVPIDQDVFVLWSRVFDNIIETNKAQHPEGNVYDEFVKVIAGVPVDSYAIQGPVLAGTEMQLPLDSRNGGNVQKYIVGSGQLEMYKNGQKIDVLDDWNEFGTAGALSSRVTFTEDLPVGDKITFRIGGSGAVYFASDGGGSGGSLQASYDAGRFINVASGQPIVITGSSGKLMSIQGDLEVTGVIDPKGITFSQEAVDPLQPTDFGLYRNAADHLIYKRGAGSPIDISGGFSDPGNKQGAFAFLLNNTGSTILAGAVVVASTIVDGAIKLASNNNLVNSEATVGVASANILNGASGYIQISGIATVLGSSFTKGKRVFVSGTPGQATSNVPSATGAVQFAVGVAVSATQVNISPEFIGVNQNIYDEFKDILAPVISGASVTLPNDSRNGGAARSYVVGAGALELYKNGQYLNQIEDWNEVGAPGTDSFTVTFTENLVIGDVITFRINLSGQMVVTGGGGGTDLENITVDIQPTSNGSNNVGSTVKGWKALYLKDTTNSDIYEISVIAGVFQVTLVP